MRKQRKPTSPAQLELFVTSTLQPLLRQKRVSVLVVCAGELDEWVWESLRRAASTFGIRVLSKLDVLKEIMPSFPGFNDFNTIAPTEREGATWIQATMTDAAIVDAILLEHATVTVMTTTSSLTSFLYAKTLWRGAAPLQWSPSIP